MLTNAKVGTKLLAVIIAPVMVLLAVASLGARDRLDDAAEANQVEDAAALTALTDDAVRSLGTERLLSAGFIAGDRDDGLDEARDETDATLRRLRPVLTSIGGADAFGEGAGQVLARVDAIDGIRAGSDAVDVEVVIDTYTLAIDELIRLEAEVAATTSAAELSTALGNANVLSQAQEARSLLAAYGAVATGTGEYEPGALELYTDLLADQDRLLARFLDGASPTAATELRDALATPEAVVADAQVDELISDATIGGAGAPQIDLGAWTGAQSRWLEAVGSVDSRMLRAVSTSAEDQAFSATKSARLFMMATAGAILLSILLAIWVARSIDRPLRRLTSAANELATDRLPRLVENLRSPDADIGEVEALEPIEVHSTDEIGQMTEAFNAIQQVTVTVAEEQSALLRKGIGDIFVNLARRNQSLLDRQIEFIDELEAKEQDPDLLENLFRLDHLATRMRRNAESLLVLAGAEPARRRAKPVALADVVRVAVGEVEDYTRVELLDLDDAIVAGNLAVDLSHLLSELMENATHFSPPESAVEVAGQFGPTGAYVLTVTDHGIGMSGEDLAEANELLASPPLVGLALGRSLGFIVVGRIAVRLGLRVHLDASPAGGVTGVISLPPDLVARPHEAEPRDPLLDRSPATASRALESAPLDRPDDLSTVGGTGTLSSDLLGDPTPPPLTEPGADPEPVPGVALFEPGTPSVDPDVTAPFPARQGGSASPADQLSDALPEGDDFEMGLAALIGPEGSDEDVEHQFWGSLADQDDDESLPPPPDEPAPLDTAPEPLDAPPAAAEQPAPLVERPSGATPAPPPPEGPDRDVTGNAAGPTTGSGGLVRRVPGAATEPSLANAPSVDAPRRSPEQVRAMLSRYRDGRQGRPDTGPPPEDTSTTEDV